MRIAGGLDAGESRCQAGKPGRARSHAAWKLSDGGPAQEQALPALNRRLSDVSDAVRINAALAVYRIGNQTNDA